MKEKEEELLVFIDGECGLCDRSAYFLYKHEREPVFRFAGLQSELARSEFTRRGKEVHMDSVYLLYKGDLIEKIRAYRILFSFLKFPYNLLSVLLHFTPLFLADFFYDLIVRNRHKLYSLEGFCPVDASGFRKRFIDKDVIGSNLNDQASV